MVRALPPGLGPERPRAPAAGAGGRRAGPSRPWPGPWPRPSPSTTSPACGPGTGPSWTRWSSRPTSAKAVLRRAVACWRPSGPGPPGSTASPPSGWRPTSRCRSPIPCGPATTCPRRTGRRVLYQDRIRLVLVDDQDERFWIGDHRVVDDFAHPDELALDERLLTACWAWEQIELPLAGRRRPPHRAAARRRAAAHRRALHHDGEAQRRGPPRRGGAGDARPVGLVGPDPVVDALRAGAPSGRPASVEPGRGRLRPAGRALPRAAPGPARGGPAGRDELGHGPRRRATPLRPPRRPASDVMSACDAVSADGVERRR